MNLNPFKESVPLSIHGAVVIPGKDWAGLGRIWNVVVGENGQQTSIVVAYGSSLEEKVKLTIERFRK